MKSQYDNHVFAPYEFREFPKWVKPDGADKPILVQNEDEEAEVMGSGEAPIRDEEVKARMLKLADVKSVPVDKRWGVDKIRKALIAAEVDPEIDPDQ